jgi:hypothetical protein
MTPHVEKLVADLSKKGITFTQDDGLGNVVFVLDGEEQKISHWCFYRFSGIATIRKELGKNQVQLIQVTDDMFINEYMKSLIEFMFFGDDYSI